MKKIALILLLLSVCYINADAGCTSGGIGPGNDNYDDMPVRQRRPTPAWKKVETRKNYTLDIYTNGVNKYQLETKPKIDGGTISWVEGNSTYTFHGTWRLNESVPE